jgi:hypothetical protein
LWTKGSLTGVKLVVDRDFRRGLGLAVFGIALLLLAVVFGLVALANGPSSGASVVAFSVFLGLGGVIVCSIGAGFIGSQPALPPGR